VHLATRVVATLAFLIGCSRDDSAKSAGRADAPATPAHATVTPPSTRALDCPTIDSLLTGDTLSFHAAVPRGVEPVGEPERFCFALSDGIYQLESGGEGLRVNAQGTHSFKLDWQHAATMQIESLLMRTLAGDVLLAFQITDGESGAATVTRLERSTLRQRWHAHIPSFNISPPVIDGSAAYVSAMGFVGRVNLETGSYAWSVRDLYDYRTGHFNSVDSIRIRGDTVVFASTGSGRSSRLLLLHRENGTLLARREVDTDRERSQ
jgi:outer membrane protein assembly factor BamB